MAYLTCPDCRMPSPVEDGAISYRCFSCAAEIIFEACHQCEYPQAIPSRWFGAFTCGHCESKVDIPRLQHVGQGPLREGVRPHLPAPLASG